jgi:hypothetical protein
MRGSEHTTDEHSAKPGPGFGVFLLKAVVLFVVITGGVAMGVLLANHFSKRDVAGRFDTHVLGVLNQTSLEVGDSLPAINLHDERDSTLALTPLVRGRKAILGFVSGGCEPCDELVEFLKERNVPEAGRCRVLLLAVGMQGYQAEGFDVFRVDRPIIDELKVRIFPTVIGLDADGKVAFVSSGFSHLMTAPLIDRHL